MADLLFLAYAAMKREAGGKPVMAYEAWCETVADITTDTSSPKVTEPEA